MLKSELLACIINKDSLYYKNILDNPYRYGYTGMKKIDLQKLVNTEMTKSKKKAMLEELLKNGREK